MAQLSPTGAFLLCYTFFLLTLGIPGFFLEVSVGQLTGQGVVTCWRRMCPLMEGMRLSQHLSEVTGTHFAARTPDITSCLMKGIGYGTQVIAIYMVTYYIVILAWAFLYLFFSFHTVLPWVSCNNTWNTGRTLEHPVRFIWVQKNCHFNSG